MDIGHPNQAHKVRTKQLPDGLEETIDSAWSHPAFGAKRFLELADRDWTLTYHNSAHTLEVYAAAMELADREITAGNATGWDTHLAGIAALFHDTGFAGIAHDLEYVADPWRITPKKGTGLETDRQVAFDKLFYNRNEPVGARLAERYMRHAGYPDHDIQRVTHAILITDLSQDPDDAVGKILRDADLSYLGSHDTQEFLQEESSLRDEIWVRPHAALYKAVERKMGEMSERYGLTSAKEFHQRGAERYDQLWSAAWREVSQAFITDVHRWHTDSAREHFQPLKERNLRAYDTMRDRLLAAFERSITPYQQAPAQ